MDVRKTYKLFVNGEFVRSESGRAYRPDGMVNVPRGSRKDLRDAVRAARTAFPGWAGRTAMNRGQILYRAAEMLDGRAAQFVELLGGGVRARRELERSVETLVWYAGWTDKLPQVTGTVNPVAGPYFNFTIPEPTGVVAIVAPERDALSGLVRRLAPVLCGIAAVGRADAGRGVRHERRARRRCQHHQRPAQGAPTLALVSHGHQRDRHGGLHHRRNQSNRGISGRQRKACHQAHKGRDESLPDLRFHGNENGVASNWCLIVRKIAVA